MRVIAGSAKGRRLQGPKEGHPIRPVLDQVKESLFNILFDISDLQVLDCFAGTGAIGIEALSRGAAHCTFIDKFSPAIAMIGHNLEHCKLHEQATLLRLPAERALRQLGKRGVQFDLLFIDPPYDCDLVSPSLAQAVKHQLLAPNARIIVEHSPYETITLPEGLAQTDQRKYGQTLMSFFAQTEG